jgi:hypothetical protein
VRYGPDRGDTRRQERTRRTRGPRKGDGRSPVTAFVVVGLTDPPESRAPGAGNPSDPAGSSCSRAPPGEGSLERPAGRPGRMAPGGAPGFSGPAGSAREASTVGHRTDQAGGRHGGRRGSPAARRAAVGSGGWPGGSRGRAAAAVGRTAARASDAGGPVRSARSRATVSAMTNEDPPEAGPVCARESCGRPVPASLGTRPRRYCSRNCRQRAYEERKIEAQVREARAAALAAALRGTTSRDAVAAPRATSRDDRPEQGATSRDAPPPAAPAPRAAAPRLAPAAPGSLPANPVGAGGRRRRLLPPPPGADRGKRSGGE